MPSRKTRADHHANRNPLRNQGDSLLRVRLSRLLQASCSLRREAQHQGSSVTDGAEKAMRRIAPLGWPARVALIRLPRRSCRRLSRCRYAPSTLAARPRLRAGSLQRSPARQTSYPMAPTPVRPDESCGSRALAMRSLDGEVRLLTASTARKTAPRHSCPHQAQVWGWWAGLAPTPTRGAPAPGGRVVRYRLRCLKRRRSKASCLAPNRSGTWVLSWMSVAGILSTMAGLLAYVLVSRPGMPTAAAWLAGITAAAATARALLAMPAAIKALKDLRP